MVTYNLFDDLHLWGAQALAGLGYRHIRFVAPVFPDDVLHAEVLVAGKKESSRKDRGTVTFDISTRCEDGREVLSLCVDILGMRQDIPRPET